MWPTPSPQAAPNTGCINCAEAVHCTAAAPANRTAGTLIRGRGISEPDRRTCCAYQTTCLQQYYSSLRTLRVTSISLYSKSLRFFNAMFDSINPANSDWRAARPINPQTNKVGNLSTSPVSR